MTSPPGSDASAARRGPGAFARRRTRSMASVPRSRPRGATPAAATSPPGELEAIYAAAPIGLAVFDTSMRYLRINARLAEINGRPLDAHLGRTIRDMVPDLADQAEAIIAEVLARGESANGVEFVGETAAQPGVPRTWITHWTPVRGADDAVAAVSLVAQEVTALRRAEASARARSERNKRLVQAAPGFMCSLSGAQHRFEFANQAYLRLIGGRQVIGRTVREALPEVADQGFCALLDRVYASGERYVAASMAADLLDPLTGAPERHWLDFIYEPIRDADGTVTGIFVQGHDVTRRVLAEQARMEIAARFEHQVLLFDSIAATTPDFLYVFDLAGRFQYANRRLLDVWGLPLEQVVGRTCLELGYEPWHHDMHMREIAQVVATKRAIKGEVPFRAPGTGIFGVYEYIFTPALDAAGAVAFVAGVTRDITERKDAEAALRDSEERFRLAVQSASLGTFDVDLATGTLTWSDTACRMFGYDDAEATPVIEPISRIHPDDRPRVEAALAAASDPLGTGDYADRHRIVLPDGSQRWIEAVGRCTYRDDGGERRAARLVGILRDVTGQQTLLDALRDADQRKDEFLAMLAHELRNPLAPLKNALHVVERTEPLTARGRATIGMAQRQTWHLQRLVDDLLEVSRITRGTIELQREPMSIGVAVHNAVESVAGESGRRGHRLRVLLPPEPIRIHADPVRIAQVLENLLLNACKYTPDGGAIAVEAARVADAVEIRVVDDGIGIEPDQQPHLFDLFHQVDRSSDRAQGGLGIGLALVRKLVEIHGGSVACRSEGLGRGSTFVIRLPVDSAHAGTLA